VLWFEHDLYDQLQFLDALSLVDEADAVEVIVAGTSPDGGGFRGLGGLAAAELEALWSTRAPVTTDALEAAATLWRAVRAPSPELLGEAVSAPTPSLPSAVPALRRLLEELPGVHDGLSGTERRLLWALSEGCTTAAEAFVRSQSLEEAPFLGDAWFFRALGGLARGGTRLVETVDGAALPRPPPLGAHDAFALPSIRLTRAGERVLAGRGDRVALLGIDRWVGGTHLRPGHVWRWHAEAGELLPPPA
jgi:hypothetical protein